MTEEQDFIWKYRFYLSQREKALTKFLQCVHWKNEEEVKQALDLLSQWVTVNTEDALELLGPTHEHPKVRAYAVSRLQQTSDDDLLLYLLQLVQALRYENYDPNSIEQIESFTGNEQNMSVSFLLIQINSILNFLVVSMMTTKDQHLLLNKVFYRITTLTNPHQLPM